MALVRVLANKCCLNINPHKLNEWNIVSTPTIESVKDYSTPNQISMTCGYFVYYDLTNNSSLGINLSHCNLSKLERGYKNLGYVKSYKNVFYYYDDTKYSRNVVSLSVNLSSPNDYPISSLLENKKVHKILNIYIKEIANKATISLIYLEKNEFSQLNINKLKENTL